MKKKEKYQKKKKVGREMFDIGKLIIVGGFWRMNKIGGLYPNLSTTTLILNAWWTMRIYLGWFVFFKNGRKKKNRKSQKKKKTEKPRNFQIGPTLLFDRTQIVQILINPHIYLVDLI